MIEFLVFIFISFFVPGFVFVKRPFEAMALGIALFTLVSYVFGYFGSELLMYFYLAFFVFLFFKKGLHKSVRELFPKNLAKDKNLLLVLVIAGTIFTNSLMFRSGQMYEFGIGYWGPLGHDGVWHEALVNELTTGFPPNNPTLSGEKLINYHYLYDLLVSRTAILTNLEVRDLIYRYYPIFFSILLGFGSYLLSQKLFKNKLASLFAVFFVYFGSSFGWIVEYIKQGTFGGESAFWINQPVSLNLNPPFAASLILVVSFLILFNEFLKDKREGLIIPLSLIAGVLVGFKVYAGILILGGLLVFAFYQLVQERKFGILKVFLLALFISLLIFLPNNKGASSLLVLSPFWFIHSMIDFADRVGWQKASALRPLYLQDKKWVKFIGLEALGLAIFVVGNLGTRIFSIFSIERIRPKDFKLNTHRLILVMSAAAFLFPLLFIQRGTNWNTIQFMYYFVYFTALYSGYGLFVLQKRLKNFSTLVVLVILLITPISSIGTFRAGFGEIPPTSLPRGEFFALEFLKTQEGGVVLTYPYAKREVDIKPTPLYAYTTSAYVSAYSGKETYLTDLVQQEIFQTDIVQRLSNQEMFFSSRALEWSYDFLRKEDIGYIYLPKVFSLPAGEGDYPLRKIFENESVNIYKVE